MQFKKKQTKRFFRALEIVGLIIIGAGFVYRYIFTEGFNDNPSLESLEKYYRQETIRGWIELPGYILFGAGIIYEMVSPSIYRKQDNTVNIGF